MRFVLLLALTGCAAHHRHVFVPKTPEAQSCWSGCRAKADSCDPGDMPSSEAYVDTASLSSRDRARADCEDQRLDCLLTCPGAHEDGS